MMRLLGKGNHGGLQAAGAAHFPMGPEPLGMAGGAQAADIDVLRRQTGAQEPQPVQSGQIHVPLGTAALQIGRGRFAEGRKHGIR